MMTFIIAVGQNELLTNSDTGEVSECHVIRITDIEKCAVRMHRTDDDSRKGN